MKAQFFLLLAIYLFSFAQNPEPNQTTTQIENFQPFTGKINSKKVRIRTAPDVESTVVTTYNEGQLVTVLGKVDDFYAIEPTTEIKLYVYRNFVVDGKIEGNNINVRLAPDLNAPIIAKLQQGDIVAGTAYGNQNQWMEIEVPHDLEFFVAQEYVDQVGDKDMLIKMHEKKEKLNQEFENFKARIEKELKLPFEKMNLRDCEKVAEKIVKNASHEVMMQATQMLYKLKESYLSKKIASLEMQLRKEEVPVAINEQIEPFTLRLQNLPEGQRIWHKKEFDRFLVWASQNPGKSFETFLMYEKDGAILLKGKVEKFECELENIPGNYLLIQNDYPVAYLYCLDNSLEENVGKEISFLAQPRNNLNFAFPAYVALELK